MAAPNAPADPQAGARESCPRPSSSTRSARRGVLLLNLGTPDVPTTRAVRRYLAEFLSDPEVIRLPRRWRWLTGALGRMIALLRAPSSAALYRNIWTEAGSPLAVITAAQAAALERTLPAGWRAFHAMRYGTPSTADVVARIVDAGIEELVVVPMYPQHSGPTTGTAVRALYEALERSGRRLSVTVRNCWYDDAGYVDTQARRLAETARAHALDPADTHLVFSAHSMPQSYVRDGDPYQQQMLRTVELVTRRLGWPADRFSVTYQSKLGPVPWLEPSTDGRLDELAAAGERRVLVCPISFTADCLESLEEIGIRSRERFEANGGTLHLCPALNTFGPFIKTLAQLVLRGPKPVRADGPTPVPLLTPVVPIPADVGVESLVMIGVSLSGTLGPGPGPALRHVTADQFQRLKRPHDEITTLLRTLADAGGFHECWLWNTCRRFELYGWLTDPPRSSAADQQTARAVSRLAAPARDLAPVNVLRGRDAWHHLLRTAAGLNSGLPGDVEVAAQLDVAHRVARRSGTAGPLTDRLITEMRAQVETLRGATPWGVIRPAYCTVALERVAADVGVDWATARCVIVGGSATARSILVALREQFDVPARHITAVYRTHCRGTQVKRLRQAMGDGRRLRVEAYRDRRALAAVAEADLVVLAVDHRTPLLHAADLPAGRDFAARPLAVLDFNTFGSTDDLATLAGVHLVAIDRLEAEMARYAETLCASPEFDAASREAAAWIHDRVPPPAAGSSPAPSPAALSGAASLSGGVGDDDPALARPWRTLE